MFENISKKIANVSRGVVNSTKKIAEGISLGSQADELKKELTECYTKLGETFYSRTKENIPEVYQGIFERIRMLEMQITKLQEQMKKVKSIRNCPKCGQEADEDAIFCPNCGFSLPPVVMTLAKPDVPQKRCSGCGAMVDEDAVYCTECGWSFINQSQIMEEDYNEPIYDEGDDEATVLINNCQEEAEEERPQAEQLTSEEIETIRVCKKCGAPLRPQSMFCTNCGTSAKE